MTPRVDEHPAESTEALLSERPCSTDDPAVSQSGFADRIRWLDNSLFDPNGRLFWLDQRLCRAMKVFGRDFYAGLLDVVAGNDILTKGMVATTLTDLTMDGVTAVLEHEVIHPFLKPAAWSSSMFYDAALCHCNVNLELAKAGYTFQDAHLWNMAFKHADPAFVDLGSAIPCEGASARWLLKEYSSYIINPLFLMSLGQSDKARRYLRGSNPPLDLRDLLGHFGLRTGFDFARRTVVTRIGRRRGFVNMIEGVREHVRALAPTPQWSVWRGYHEDEDQRAKPDWHAKQRHMEKIVSQLRPNTVLDVGSATGWYSVLAAESGCQVVALDSDNEMVNTVHRLAQQRKLPITPCLGDLFARDNPLEGCKFDLVQALAIIHHLYFTQRLTFEFIAQVLSAHTAGWLVTEFIDHNDSFVKRQPAELRDGYTLEMFLAALKRVFGRIETYSSSSDNRTLLLCEK